MWIYVWYDIDSLVDLIKMTVNKGIIKGVCVLKQFLVSTAVTGSILENDTN